MTLENNRVWRVRVDYIFPAKAEGAARGLFTHAVNQIDKAINITKPGADPEISRVDLERCGHELGDPCEVLDHREVPL